MIKSEQIIAELYLQLERANEELDKTLIKAYKKLRHLSIIGNQARPEHSLDISRYKNAVSRNELLQTPRLVRHAIIWNYRLVNESNLVNLLEIDESLQKMLIRAAIFNWPNSDS